jgi:hypothetical protein
VRIKNLLTKIIKPSEVTITLKDSKKDIKRLKISKLKGILNLKG